MRLSVLDFFSKPQDAIELASAADALGYYRYWIGEHHTPLQCPNPLLVATLIAGFTPRIRVGTGAVSLMLRNPMLVAEDASLAIRLFGNRLDLGVAPALSLEPSLRDAIAEGRPMSADAYPDRVRDLLACLKGPTASSRVDLAGAPASLPVWLLGTSPRTAQLAAEHGLGFCTSFHHGLAEDEVGALIRSYRSAFRPSEPFDSPYAITVISGALRSAAHAIPSEHDSGYGGIFRRRVTFGGRPRECVDQLRRLAAITVSDEMMVLSFVVKDVRKRSLELLQAVSDEVGLATIDDRSS